jgi:hypothetical protein
MYIVIVVGSLGQVHMQKQLLGKLDQCITHHRTGHSSSLPPVSFTFVLYHQQLGLHEQRPVTKAESSLF